MYSHFFTKTFLLLLLFFCFVLFCLLSNSSHPDNNALTKGTKKSEFPRFQNLELSSKIPKKLVNQHDTGKVPNFQPVKIITFPLKYFACFSQISLV